MLSNLDFAISIWDFLMTVFSSWGRGFPKSFRWYRYYWLKNKMGDRGTQGLGFRIALVLLTFRTRAGITWDLPALIQDIRIRRVICPLLSQ